MTPLRMISVNTASARTGLECRLRRMTLAEALFIVMQVTVLLYRGSVNATPKASLVTHVGSPQ
jgi:hypothetical protein